MEPADEIVISLSLAEWNQIRVILAEQNAAFQAQIERNNATISKITEQLYPPAAKTGPQLVS